MNPILRLSLALNPLKEGIIVNPAAPMADFSIKDRLDNLFDLLYDIIFEFISFKKMLFLKIVCKKHTSSIKGAQICSIFIRIVRDLTGNKGYQADHRLSDFANSMIH
jgi:hypothetical protein